MTTPELINYIKGRLQAAESKENISSALLGQGWMQNDIDEAFGIVMPPPPQPLQPSQSLPSQSSQPQPQQPSQTLPSLQPSQAPALQQFQPIQTQTAPPIQTPQLPQTFQSTLKTTPPVSEIADPFAASRDPIISPASTAAAPAIATANPAPINIDTSLILGVNGARGIYPMRTQNPNQQIQNPQTNQNLQTSSQNSQTLQTLQAKTAMAIRPKKHHFVRTLLVIIVLLLLILGGGAVYAYFTGNLIEVQGELQNIPVLSTIVSPIISSFLSLPFLSVPPYNSNHLLIGIVSGAEKIHSATYQANISAHMKDRDPSAMPFTLPASANNANSAITQSLARQFVETESEINYIPADFSTTVNVSGSSDTSNSAVNSQARAQGSVTVSGITLTADVQLEKIDSNLYVMVNEFPGFFFDLSPILQKWIEITPADLSSYANSYGTSAVKNANGSTNASTNPLAMASSSLNTNSLGAKLNSQQIVSDLTKMLTLADQDQVLTVAGEPTKDSLNGETVYKYPLTINQNNLLKFTQDILNINKQNGATAEDLAPLQDAINEMKDPTFAQLQSYLNSVNTLDLWVNSQGVPVKISNTMELVPSAPSTQGTTGISNTTSNTANTTNATNTAPQNKQLEISVSMTLSGINQPVSLTAPATNMTLQAAEKALSTGASPFY